MSHQIQKGWMDKYIFSNEFRNGVRYFIQFAIKYGYSKTDCSCPCSSCQNKYNFDIEKVKLHLFTKGIDQRYRMWSFHGENSTNMMIKNSMGEHVEEENVPEVTTKDGEIGINDFVDIACGVHEVPNGDVLRDEIDQFEEPFTLEPDLGKRYNKYKILANEKLYLTCEGPDTTLSAIVELHNMKKMFGWSGNSVTYLLSTLKKWLPKENKLPMMYPVMKEMLKDLGMEAKCIHACQYHCILYYGEHENATSCPVCGTPRYKVKQRKSGNKETKEPCKVLRYFPVGQRLKKLYTISWIAHKMIWHHRATVSSDSMRHLIDSAQWAAIKLKYPEFADEGRNVWLGIATDGFNPRGIQSCGYSCWPVIMVPYNLPPSLCMKSEFQMMTLLIPGPKAPGQDIDVFLQPLVDELKQLWENGIEAFDMYQKESFQMKAIVIVGIHDLPAFGNLFGCIVHGYFACPVCADDTQSIHLPHGSKIVYINYRKFLPFNHPFRKGKFLGLRSTENEHAPNRLSGRPTLFKLRKVSYKPGHNDLRRALHQISLFFRMLCSKVIIRSQIQEAKYMVAEAMCVLEKYFPPAFFDISIHLMVHLADEALLCGPVRYRWMYPFERAMKECKNIPSNKRYVEGSIAESYLVSESVRYAMEYMPNSQDGNHKATWEAFLEEGSEFNDEGPMLEHTNVLLSSEQFVQIRRWVLFRRDIEGLADYYSIFCESGQSNLRSGGRGMPINEVERQTNFIDWLYNKLLEENNIDSELWRYVKGPLGEAKEYKKYRVNGFLFSPVP